MAKLIKFQTEDGAEHILNVGKWAFTEYLGEALGVENPLNGEMLSHAGQTKWVTAMVFAGKRVHYETQKKDLDFTKESVGQMLRLMEDDEIKRIIDEYIEFNKSKEKPGELLTPAVQ